MAIPGSSKTAGSSTLKVVFDNVDSEFPLMVDAVDTSSLRDAVQSDDLGGRAGDTISRILSWRGRPTDGAGFEAALKASFSLSESEGHVVATYTPRSMSIAADLGALTGAQASLYARAQSAQELVVKLLDGLTPLDPAPDLEDTEALRRLVRESVLELVAELGTAGGPRIARVDTLFKVLTGADSGKVAGGLTALTVEGQLGQLRDRFGLRRVNVFGLDDEQVLTSFYTIVDSVTSLRYSWTNQKPNFTNAGGRDGFFGPEMTWLSRNLAAAADQLKEVRFLLGSVFISPADQEIINVGAGSRLGGRSGIPLADLLSWLEEFLTVRGPRLVTENGRDGVVEAFRPMVITLSELVDELTTPSPTWPKGMRSSRVKGGFASLAASMLLIKNRVTADTRAGVDITKVEPTAYGVTQSGDVIWMLRITGHGFLQDHAVQLTDGTTTIAGDVVRVVSHAGPGMTETSAMLVQVAACPGTWELSLHNSSGVVDAQKTVPLP